MNRFFACLVCASLCATGCKCADAPAPKLKSTATKVAAEKRNAAMENLNDVPVPTEEDYEEKLQEEITDQNLDSELDKLDKEIGDVPAPPTQASAQPPAQPSAQPQSQPQ
jgi:hypothetical protein